MPSVEGELGDGRDEDRWGVVVADLDLAHEAEGVAGVEHIGHSAAAVRVPAACRPRSMRSATVRADAP